jgi:hypothetical protein
MTRAKEWMFPAEVELTGVMLLSIVILRSRYVLEELHWDFARGTSKAGRVHQSRRYPAGVFIGL